ncbi:MAG TPA: TetR/AcrR family transcriptional regulator [Terriglobales bacterium]|nr:TetR/AcrR family transcriptional regulator [Terriglobales bacterium]
MPRSSTNTRERIILAAVELFYAHGYAATGMADILRKARANSGSFYFFFKSKEDLLHAVLDWYLENLEPILIHPLYERSHDPIERVFLLLDDYRKKILLTNFEFTCPIGRLALEIDPERRRTHQKIAANFNGWTDAVRKCLDDAATQLPAAADREQLAQLVLTVMEGGVMQSRAQHDIRPYDASVGQLRQYFRSLQEMAAAEQSHLHTKRRRS